MTITDQMNKFLKNCFDFELDLRKDGRTRIKTAIKKIAGIICSKLILTIPKTFCFLKKFLDTRVRFFILNFSKSL